MSDNKNKNSGAEITNGRFQNLPNPDIRKPSRKTYVSFVMRMMKYSREIVDIPEGHIVPQDKAAENVRQRLKEGADFITWLGQASFVIRMGGKTFLTDPYLSSHASPSRIAGPKRFVEPGLRIEDLPKIDYLVLSHNHYDHLDTRTLKKLAGKTEMMAIVPLGLGKYMEKRGFRTVQEMDWWDSFQAGEVTLRALPSQHWSKRTLFDRNKSLWASFSFEGKNSKVFFTGDTGYGPLFKDIGEDFGPFDYTLVGIGAYEPREIMKAHHTNPEEAVQIGLDVKSRVLVGMHWGTVRLTDEPLFEPPGRFLQAAENAGYDAENTWVMSIGESRSI